MLMDTTQAVRIKTIVVQDGVIHLFGPFRAGEAVEVIVLNEPAPAEVDRYSLRGTPYTYVDPFSGVADDEWDSLK